MTDASVVIFTYDITRKESFDQLRNFWYNQVLKFTSKKIGKS